MIIIADDEPYRVEPWSDALEKAFPGAVRLVHDGADLARLLEEQGERVEVLIRDLMMPTPPGWDREQTEAGTRTGAVFYRRARDQMAGIDALAGTANILVDQAWTSNYRRVAFLCWLQGLWVVLDFFEDLIAA